VMYNKSFPPSDSVHAKANVPRTVGQSGSTSPARHLREKSASVRKNVADIRTGGSYKNIPINLPAKREALTTRVTIEGRRICPNQRSTMIWEGQLDGSSRIDISSGRQTSWRRSRAACWNIGRMRGWRCCGDTSWRRRRAARWNRGRMRGWRCCWAGCWRRSRADSRGRCRATCWSQSWRCSWNVSGAGRWDSSRNACWSTCGRKASWWS